MPENQEYEALIRKVKQEIKFIALKTRFNDPHTSTIEKEVITAIEEQLEKLIAEYPDTWDERLLEKIQESIISGQKALANKECEDEVEKRFTEILLKTYKSLYFLLTHGNHKSQEWLDSVELTAKTSDYQDKYEMGWAVDHYKINTLLFECVDEIKKLRVVLEGLRSAASAYETLPSEVVFALLDSISLDGGEEK